MEHQASILDYKEAILFLLTAGIVVPVFHRLRISPVLGFIAAGVLLGPFGLGRLAQDWPAFEWVSIGKIEQLTKIADLGVAFLLFMIGLELSFERLTTMRKLIFGLGAAQVLVTTLVIGEIAHFAGLPLKAAVVVGAALALSSTAIVMPALAERNRLNTPAGHAAFAILLFQDLMVAAFLFMIAILGDVEPGSDVLSVFVSTLAPALIGLAALVGLGRLLIRPLFHHVAAAKSTELFVAACLLVIISAGLAAVSSGMSMALGAFIAGLLLAETEFRREVEVTIEPFKGLLLGLFFLTVGAALDLQRVMAQPFEAIGIAVALIVGKFIITYGLALFAGIPSPAAREAALVNAPGGEFAFVMLIAATAAGLLDRSLASLLALSVTLSMITIPGLAALGARLAFTGKAPVDPAARIENAPAGELEGHVIIVGHGRVGALVGEMLARHKIPFMAVDGDATLVGRGRDSGLNIYWGDASRPDFLRKCGIESAKAVVVTMDAPKAVEKVVQTARGLRPDLTVVARARDAEHATHLYEIGATDAVPETIEASLQLAEALLVDIGVPSGFVIASVHEKRDEFRAVLQSHGVHKERRGIRLSKRIKEMASPRKTEPSA